METRISGLGEDCFFNDEDLGAKLNAEPKEDNNTIKAQGMPDSNSIAMTPIEPEVFSIKRSFKLIAAISVSALFIILWITRTAFKEYQWKATIELSVYFSARPNIFLSIFSWIFAEIFYKWHVFLPAILLTFAPRKDKALASITIYMASYLVRQHIRLLDKESRPMFDSPEIKNSGDCSCSYGMPSGHCEGVTLLYGLLAINFMPLRASRKTVFVAWGSIYAIITCVYFTRIYYGAHSFMQVGIGAAQGWGFLIWYLYFEAQVDRFFFDILNMNLKKTLRLWVAVGTTCFISFLLWVLCYEDSIYDAQISHQACSKCFKNHNERIRDDLGKAMMFCFTYFGLILGLISSSPSYTIDQESIVQYSSQILSIKGLKKAILMVVVYAPIGIPQVIPASPFWGMIMSLIGNIVGGYLIGKLPTFAQNNEIQFEGDIKFELSTCVHK